MKTLAMLLSFAAACCLIGCSPKDYAWAQHATLTVAVHEGVFEGSTVQRVEWRRNWPRIPGFETDVWSTSLQGEAPFVVLPNAVVVVATLGGETRRGFARLLVEEFEGSNVNHSLPPNEEALRRTDAAVDAKSAVSSPTINPPMIIGFASANDPESAFWVSPTNATARALGIVSAKLNVKKSNQPVSPRHITQALPWLSEMDEASRVLVESDTGRVSRIPPSAFLGDG